MCTLDYNDYYDFSIRTQSTHIRSTQRYPGLGGYPLQLMVHLQQYLFLSWFQPLNGLFQLLKKFLTNGKSKRYFSHGYSPRMSMIVVHFNNPQVQQTDNF